MNAGAMSHTLRVAFAALLLVLLGGCTTAPPKNMDSSCAIFEQYGGWYKATKRVQAQYGVPQQIQLAIIHQESKFSAEAKTPRRYLLGFIPWTRKSSAYGYAQVKDETWAWYQDKSGHWLADRDDFGDAVEFVGWYADYTQKTLGISKWDAYNLYLAYHEGPGGFKAKTYLGKPWLIEVARKVKARSERYGAQLRQCRADLDGPWWWPF